MVQSSSKFRGRGKIREELAILEVHTYLLESLPSPHYVHLLEENCFRSLNQQHSIQLFRGGLSHKLVKVNASAMTKWRPNCLGDLMVTQMALGTKWRPKWLAVQIGDQIWLPTKMKAA